jgi:hypothetical protein
MPNKLVPFRLNDETMKLLQSFKERHNCSSWNETFVKLLKLEEQKTTYVMHDLKDLKPCTYRLLGCAKKHKEISLDECYKCNQAIFKA